MEEPLLPQSTNQTRRQGLRQRLKTCILYRNAHPYWLIPIIIVASMCRGMTMAPRIEVYNKIACRTVHRSFPSPVLHHPITYLRDTGTIPMPAYDLCSSSSVQARAARIQASITTTSYVLSTFSTGLWSRFGDAHGRRIVFSLAILGALSMDAVFILAVTGESIFSRYDEQFIITGSALDGVLGGLPAFQGVVNAYTSDCTAHGSRSKVFATMQGTIFVGLSLGPWVGAWALKLLSATDTYSLFYVSMACLLIAFGFVALLLPESLQRDVPPVDLPGSRCTEPRVALVRRVHKRLRQFATNFMSPIVMFSPRVINGKRDCNLTFLGSALFVYLISIGLYQIKYLYAKHIFSWSTAELGFYMSLLWTSRAVNLLVILPVVVSYIKPEIQGVTALEQIASEMRFDKRLAQISVAIDGLADALIVIFPTKSQISFLVFSNLSSFMSGGNPAIHSLGAVCLHNLGRSSEVGALFGAISVLSAIAHTLSPALYAFTYGSTVGYFPKAIFCLAAGLLLVVISLLSAISPGRGGTKAQPEESTMEAETTAQSSF